MPKKNSKKKIEIDVSNEDSDNEGGDELCEIINNHIYFYSDISNKTAFELIKALDKVKRNLDKMSMEYEITKRIHLHINSFGGCVFSGFSIIDKMREIQNEGYEIYTYCEGKVASCGTMISVHGDKRFIGKNCYMLIHQLSSGFWGKFTEFEDEYENCVSLMKRIKKMYADNTNFRKRELDEILKRDKWLDSDKCLEKGLVDEIL